MFQRTLDAGQIAALLSRAGIAADRVADTALLGGGSFNSVYRIKLADGGALILKVAPPPEVPVLRHEHDLLRAEALLYSLAAGRGLTGVPAVVHDGDGEFLLMTELPGQPWPEVAGRLDDGERQRLRADVGRLVAGLHTITGTGFGYPTHALGPLAATWSAAFGGMMEAVLADAETFAAPLPRPAAAIRDLSAAHADALDEVTTPVLVHFDLWDGNILVDSSGGTPRVGGLIDAERAFWGDPLADFVSLALLSDIRSDKAFLDGYRQAGGPVALGPATPGGSAGHGGPGDPGSHGGPSGPGADSLGAGGTGTGGTGTRSTGAGGEVRLALYRSYLNLIMLTEMAPRAFPPSYCQRREAAVAPALAADLDFLGRGLLSRVHHRR